MKTIRDCMAVVWLLSGSALIPLIAAESPPPNIVFILADDLGYGDLGCYGQTKIRTPHLDQLAKEGLRFTRAYSGNAVCAPSRCVLMTGRHPGHARVRDNSQVGPDGQFPLPASEMTLGEVLQQKGYRTGAFGKWGLGSQSDEGNANGQGFDRFFGYYSQSLAHSYYPASLWNNGEIFPLRNDPPVPGHASFAEGADPGDPASYAIFQGSDYAPDRIHVAALEFLAEQGEAPFFLYYPSIIPHLALHVPEEALTPYLAEHWEDPPFTRPKAGYTPHFTPRAAYAAMISYLDRQVGELLDQLEAQGMAENTIVIFSSDNGPTHLNQEVDVEFFGSAGGLNGLKGDLLEGGIRVPQIVRWPGKIAKGGVTDRIVGFEDWLPTLAEAAGASIPSGLDGISMLPTLLGEKQDERPFLYREFRSYGGQQAVWLGGRWKGIRSGLVGKKASDANLQIALYDLNNDPAETTNVAGINPDIVAKIEALMRSERVVSENFPIPLLDALP
jgi:arylsulfatase A